MTGSSYSLHQSNKPGTSNNEGKGGPLAEKKLDFKDIRSVKSSRSERSDCSTPSAFMGEPSSRCTSSSTQMSGKISRRETPKNSFLPAPCFLGRRFNETRPVYRPGQPKPRSRFSLRNLLYSNPLQSPPFSSSPARTRKSKEVDTQSEGSWVERGSQVTVSSTQHSQAHTSVLHDQAYNLNEMGLRECVLCLAECTPDQFPALRNCSHLSCIICLQQYVRIEIQEGRANLKCPQCSQLIHPNDIEELVGEDTALLNLYQFLMVRRVLAADPDTRWCPAPNCSYAVVATGCASCPKIDCEKEDCEFSFCYHCKAEWHPNITCDKARAQRHPIRSNSEDGGVGGGLEIKVCPRCSVLIVKMDDGSCNHMTCAVCGSEFCWLCMKEISDLHYLSPSGCTFWGKKPWSRKKKLLWQLGTIVGAPVGIALIAGISIPAMIIGIPVWVGRKINSHHLFSSKPKRITAITAGVVSSILISPVLAGLAVSIGVPILLAYVYGVVPLSLCRSGGCGVRTTTQGVRIDVEEEIPYRKVQQTEAESRVANPSIGELSLGASLSMGSGSHLDRLVECDRESASNTAIAGYSLTGSVASSYLGQHRLEVGADVHTRKKFSFSSERLSETVSLSEKSATVSLGDDGGASTRALAGSILQYKMDNNSLYSYRTGVATPGSSGSGAPEVDGSSYRQDADSGAYQSGDEISVRSMPGQRSLSPVTGLIGEELSAALRRSSRRRILEKQQSETSAEDQHSRAASVDQELSERVRFDTHISFIDASKAELELDRTRLNLKKGELEPETLREETAEELALVVSPVTQRGFSPLTSYSFDSSPPLPRHSLTSSPPLDTPSPSRHSPPSSPVCLESTLKYVSDTSKIEVPPAAPDFSPVASPSPASPSEMSPMLPALSISLNSTFCSHRPARTRENVSLVRISGGNSSVTSINVGEENTSYFSCNSDNTINETQSTTGYVSLDSTRVCLPVPPDVD